MAKTREEREEEERQRQEELAVFGGRGLRRSIAVLDNRGTVTRSNISSSLTPTGPLPTLEEDTEQSYTSRSKGKQPELTLNSPRITRLVRIGDNNNSLGGNSRTLLPNNIKLKGDVNYNT